MDHIEESKNNNGNLSRRGFVKSGFFGRIAAAALPALAFAEKVSAPPSSHIAISSFELEEIGISELAEGMASGKYTARSIAEAFLDRIEDIDRDVRRSKVSSN